MVQTVPFAQIPQNLRIPLFWAEVDPSQANTGQQNQRTLMIGQQLSDPSKASSVVSGVLSINTSTSTLTFTNVPIGVAVGNYVFDTTKGSAITQGTRVTGVGATTVTLSAPAAGSAVSGDTIIFADLVPKLIRSARQAVEVYGIGSMLVDMVDKYRLNDSFGELWCLGLVDDVAGTAATGTIVLDGTPTQNGTIPLYINGISIPVVVTTTMDATSMGDAVEAAINAAIDPHSQNLLPVTANNVAGTVTLTAVNKGASGNDIDIRLAYLGTIAGEAVPPGITVKITAMAGGATNPSTLLTRVLTDMSDQPYDFIGQPYSDTTSLNAVKTWLDDVSGRWSWARQIYGHAFTASKGSLATLVATGTARNDQHHTIIGYYDSPSPSWNWAAALTGACAMSGRADPGLPLHNIPLIGIYAPPLQSRFGASDRNTLSWDGISTFEVQQDGTVITGLIITTYQVNPSGQPDNSYLKVETMALLTAVLRYLRARVTSKFSRKKLADDGTRIPIASSIVTPNMIKADQIAAYGDMLELGWVQADQQFSRTVAVVRNRLNPNRVDVLWSGVLISQLDVFALLAQFRLLPEERATIAA